MRDQGSSNVGWMARAPFSSGWRRNNNIKPYRPAPPPGSARYTGPNSRTFSEAVRLGRDRQFFCNAPPRTVDDDIIRGPASPQLRRLVQKLYSVIKFVHHLQNVAQKPGSTQPRMISKMVEVLSSMIKPASPTERTLDLITGNAKNWGYNTCLILSDHYESSLEEVLDTLLDEPNREWRTAFEVAVRWAQRKLPRITRDSIEHAEALILASMDPEDPPQPPKRKEVMRQGKKSSVTTGIAVQTGESLQLPGAQPSSKKPKRKRTVATMTDKEVQDTADEWDQVMGASPRSQRVGRKSRGIVINRCSTPVIPQMLEDESDSSEMSSEEESEDLAVGQLFSEEVADDGEPSGEVLPASQTTRTVVAQIHCEESSHMAASDVEGEKEKEVSCSSADLFASPEPLKEVKRHPHTHKKMIDWALEIKEKNIIIGDSNLSNFPAFSYREVQIDSFPGSHFRHGQALIEKATEPDFVVEKVILSFGINCRGNRLRETTIKTVQAAVRATKRKFPYAEVLIPLISYSENLTAKEKETLEVLNEYIKKNMPYIPLLPLQYFATESDNVHWTSETGSAMLEHWAIWLNFVAQ